MKESVRQNRNMRTCLKAKTLTIIQEEILCLSNQLNLILLLSLSNRFTVINLLEINLQNQQKHDLFSNLF